MTSRTAVMDRPGRTTRRTSRRGMGAVLAVTGQAQSRTHPGSTTGLQARQARAKGLRRATSRATTRAEARRTMRCWSRCGVAWAEQLEALRARRGVFGDPSRWEVDASNESDQRRVSTALRTDHSRVLLSRGGKTRRAHRNVETYSESGSISPQRARQPASLDPAKAPPLLDTSHTLYVRTRIPLPVDDVLHRLRFRVALGLLLGKLSLHLLLRDLDLRAQLLLLRELEQQTMDLK